MTGMSSLQNTGSGTQKRIQAAANCVLWVLKTVLGQALKLLHPFMPFITEEIYLALVPEEESLMMSSWPVYKEECELPGRRECDGAYQSDHKGHP